MTGSQQGDSALMLAIVGVSVINPVKRMTGAERLNEDEERKADESRRRFRSGTSWRQVRPKASHGLTVLPEPLMCKRFVAFFDTLAIWRPKNGRFINCRLMAIALCPRSLPDG
jgi:hypothetical protein